MKRALAFLVLFTALAGALCAEDSAQSHRIPRIGYLATPNRIRSIGDLVALAR